MAEQVTLNFRGRNPDVLTCIANLSNDEVFTPPELANQMLDLLAKAWSESHDGDNIWADKSVRFLDPFTKSGVFLREITKRLIKGLESQMPDLPRRVNHILTKQVYGIAITELTALLARRSLYCTKWATREHSICHEFPTDDGHIWFQERQHAWTGGTGIVETADENGNPITVTRNERCSYCGVSRQTLDRGEGRETHAYALIHEDDPHKLIKEAFGEDMQFDVIIGNPPYQLDDGGHGASARPIYDKFVDSAKSLEPRFLTMIIPARWCAGGKGLDAFRDEMLDDTRIRSITDYPDSRDAFDGVDIAGGVCYFLWERDNPGQANVTTMKKGKTISSLDRPLRENGADVFIRSNEALPILKKVMSVESGISDSLSLSLSLSLLISDLTAWFLQGDPLGFKLFTEVIMICDQVMLRSCQPMERWRGQQETKWSRAKISLTRGKSSHLRRAPNTLDKPAEMALVLS